MSINKILKLKIITFITLIILIFLSISGCLNQDELILEDVEVLEYQGEKLGSINDFRENSIKGPQYVNINNYTLKITGLVEKPINYSYDELLENFLQYNKVVTLFCVEGWNVKILWKGLLVKDIINVSKPYSNATIVIFHAYDGYTTSLPLNYIIDNNIIIAYKMNNVTIPPERGFPFQLVAESKWGYKWIKWITTIELSDNVDYEGYWESRGYPNEGNLPLSSNLI
jgi:DMSO/TMAO reductase YedYZ molybdopterin-dependent catalytic subunit